MHIENSQHIFIADQSTGSYTIRTSNKRNSQTDYSTYTKYKIQNIILSVHSIKES